MWKLWKLGKELFLIFSSSTDCDVLIGVNIAVAVFVVIVVNLDVHLGCAKTSSESAN
jgi:hypothetical protein